MDSEFNTTIERYQGKNEAGDRVTIEVPYTCDPICIDVSMDMSLEMVEMASPLAAMSQDRSLAGVAFADVARSIMRKGGFKYALKLFTAGKLRRGGTRIKDKASLKLAYDGVGGLLECTLALQWVVEENFGDFFTELLGSFGLTSQEEEEKVKTEEENKATN